MFNVSVCGVYVASAMCCTYIQRGKPTREVGGSQNDARDGMCTIFGGGGRSGLTYDLEEA